MTKAAKCDECGNPARWLRATQFAGDHYFCSPCAIGERGFPHDVDGQLYWVELGGQPDFSVPPENRPFSYGALKR